MADQASSRLRIDWTVPVPLLLAGAMQLAAMVWWGAGINARVSALEAHQSEMAAIPATIARLDERSQAQSDALRRLEQLGAR